MKAEDEHLERIEELRDELHHRLGGRYDPSRIAALVPISQELDRLVVEITRRQWERTVRKPRKGHR